MGRDTVKRPMLYVAAFCIAVSAFAFYELMIIFVFCIILLCGAIYHTMFVFHAKGVLLSALMFLGIIGIFLAYNHVNSFDRVSGKVLNVTLVATEDSVGHEGFVTVPVRVVDGDLPFGSKLEPMDYNSTFIHAGDVFDAKVSVYSLRDSEYRRYNYSNGIYCNSVIEFKSSAKRINHIYKSLQSVRNYVTDRLFSDLRYDVAATLNAVMTGDKAYLEKDFSDSIKLTGVSHVMVVSGQHLVIIMNSLFFVLDKLFYNRYFRLLMSTAVGLFMIAVCGFTVSIVRAGIMFFVSAAAPVIGRERDSLSSLATAVFIIIFLTPFAVYSLSFQLSVLATFGILAFSPCFCDLAAEMLKKIHLSFLKPVTDIIVNTLAATVTTLPVLIGTFGYISVVAIITNLLITYAVTLALTFAAAAMLFGMFPPIYKFFLFIAGVSTKYINYVISTVSKFSITTVSIENRILQYCLVVLSVLIIIALLISAGLIEKRKRLKRINKTNGGAEKCLQFTAKMC